MKRIAISTIAFAAGMGMAFAQTPSPGQSTPGAQAPGAQRSGGAGAAQPGRDRDDATRGQGAQGQGAQGPGQGAQGRGQSDRAPVQPEDQGARQSQPQGQSQQGQGNQPPTGGNQSQTGGNVTLTNEQRTEVRQTILQGSNAPRVDTVNFSISVGTVVPTSVRVVEVPETLVRIRPAWRGFSYFVVRDQIIIIDRDHKIVAVLNV